MGIERKNLSMSEKDRLNTAIHESGHALTCYFNKNALKLYKATIVARGGALGVVSNLSNIEFRCNIVTFMPFLFPLSLDVHGP